MASPASETPANPIPVAEKADSAEVLNCLSNAKEMWDIGQVKEAVRWVQRGAEAAEQDGNDLRALKLARMAADIAAQSPSPSPRAAPEPEPETGSAASPAEPAPAASSPSGRPMPKPPAPRVSQPPPLPANAGSSAAQETPPPPSAGSGRQTASSPTAAERRSGRPSRVPSASRAPVASAPVKEKLADKPTADKAPEKGPDESESRPAVSRHASASNNHENADSETRSASPSRAPTPPSLSRSPGPLASAPPKPNIAAPATAQLSELLASGAAERVWVKVSALDPNLMVVRPHSTSKPSHGARHAILVYVDADSLDRD